MGRGRSKLSAGGSAGKVSLGNGNVAEFDGTLVYGEKDPTLTKDERAAIEAWEKKRADSDVEYASGADDYGTEMLGAEYKGDKGSVEIPYEATDVRGMTVTHIHPRSGEFKNQLGGTFSRQDMDRFARDRFETMRAVAKEGTYSISKDEMKFQLGEFLKYAEAMEQKIFGKFQEDRIKIDSAFYSHRITAKQYRRRLDKAFNTALVEMHNAYIAGQDQYGYTYTLERKR